MATKRELECRLATLEAQNRTDAPEDDDRERTELYSDGLYMQGPEPELTDALRSCGFVVERDVRDSADGGIVLLQTTPSTGDVVGAVSWYRDGPTAGLTDIRIVWEADRLEQVRADAEHPTVYAEPDVPAETERTVIDEGEGWMAVVPSDRVITNPVERRCDAEYHGHEILGPVELPLADEYDLVEVDADPDADPHQRAADD